VTVVVVVEVVVVASHSSITSSVTFNKSKSGRGWLGTYQEGISLECGFAVNVDSGKQSSSQ